MKHKDSHVRFNSVDWYGDFKEVSVGGVGTIGTWLTLLLTRTGDHTVLLYDNDTVEAINLSGQLFSLGHVGMPKVEAMCDIVEKFTELSEGKLHPFIKKLDKDTYVSPICFSCFDNMKARKAMFDKWKSSEDRELFIDGRMSIETYEVYVVKKGQEQFYEKTLIDDSKIPDQICSLKNTSHTGALIAGRMVTSFTNHIGNLNVGMDVRTVPFHFREDMELQMINMEE